MGVWKHIQNNTSNSYVPLYNQKKKKASDMKIFSIK